MVQNGKSGSQSHGSGPEIAVGEEGSTKSIEITPIQIGPDDGEIGFNCSDNTYVRQSVHLDAVPSAKGHKKLPLDRGAQFMALVLEEG